MAHLQEEITRPVWKLAALGSSVEVLFRRVPSPIVKVVLDGKPVDDPLQDKRPAVQLGPYRVAGLVGLPGERGRYGVAAVAELEDAVRDARRVHARRDGVQRMQICSFSASKQVKKVVKQVSWFGLFDVMG